MAKATTMGPMKIKESASYRVFKVFNAIILTLISVAMLYPFLYLSPSPSPLRRRSLQAKSA